MMETTSKENTFDRLRAHRKPETVENAERFRKLLQAYLPLPRDVELEERVTDLVEHCAMSLDQAQEGVARGRLTEGRIVCVTGRSGTGKSAALHRLFQRLPAFGGYDRKESESLLVSTVAPSPGVSKQVASSLLQGLGYPVERNIQENQAWALVRRQIELRGVRFIHIDELQHIHQNPNEHEQQKIRDTLKSLLQNREWPVWLILSGTPDIAPFLQADTQIRRRCSFVRFDSLRFEQDTKTVGEAVMLLSGRAGLKAVGLLRNAEHGTTDEFVGRLMHASSSEVGTLIEIVQDASMLAIREGSSVLDHKHFATAYRRRSGCDTRNNVFLSPDWKTIVVENALYPEHLLEEKERRQEDRAFGRGRNR